MLTWRRNGFKNEEMAKREKGMAKREKGMAKGEKAMAKWGGGGGAVRGSGQGKWVRENVDEGT